VALLGGVVWDRPRQRDRAELDFGTIVRPMRRGVIHNVASSGYLNHDLEPHWLFGDSGGDFVE
jgi:hypothetical protein